MVTTTARPADPTEGTLDAAVHVALQDPEFSERCARDPAYARGLITTATQVASAAFDEADDAALDVAHRALYHLYGQMMWSPVEAYRGNEHDLTLAAVLLELERGFQRSLDRMHPPESPPRQPEEFTGWLEHLALEAPSVPDTGLGVYLRDHTTLDQLTEIVAQRSLFFQREPDPWTMVVPSLRGEAKAGLIDVLLDEYGWGRYEQMHSTVYAKLMARLGLDTSYDAYFDQTAHQFLAVQNYQGMLARNRRLSQRMYGYIYLVEAESPQAMRTYLAAYDRLGISDEDIRHFYDLHVTADEDHQRVALEEMIAPVVRAEPEARTGITAGVVGGQQLEHAFGTHLYRCFTAGRSSLRGTV